MRSLDYCSHGKKLMLAPTEPCDECKEIEDIEYMLMDLQSLTRRLLRRKAVLFSNIIPPSEAAHLRSAQARIDRAVKLLDAIIYTGPREITNSEAVSKEYQKGFDRGEESGFYKVSVDLQKILKGEA